MSRELVQQMGVCPFQAARLDWSEPLPGNSACLSVLPVLNRFYMLREVEAWWICSVSGTFLGLLSCSVPEFKELPAEGSVFPSKYPVSWASVQIECLFSKDFTTLQTLKALVLYNFVGVVTCHHKAYLRHSPYHVLCKSLVNSSDQILPISGKLFLPCLLIISFCGSLGTTFGFWGSNSGHQAWQQVPLPTESSNQPGFQLLGNVTPRWFSECSDVLFWG